MQDNLADFLGCQEERSGILEAIAALIDTIDGSTADSAEAVHEIERRLADLYSGLGELVHCEEQEVLPRLTSRAVEILSRAFILELEGLEEVLSSLSNLLEEARNLADESSDRVRLGLFQARLREEMQDIRLLLEDNAQEQESILELAQEVQYTSSAKKGYYKTF